MKVYVHVPFCRSKCAYCDFYSTPRTELMEKYVDTVGMEWTHRDGDGLGDISTIYVGGGDSFVTSGGEPCAYAFGVSGREPVGRMYCGGKSR